MEKEMLVSEEGGQRTKIGVRYDLLSWTALRQAAQIMAKGAEKYDDWNWLNLDRLTEQSPLNHAFAHLATAAELPWYSERRKRHLAKALCNVMMELHLDSQDPDEVLGLNDEDATPFVPTKDDVKIPDGKSAVEVLTNLFKK